MKLVKLMACAALAAVCAAGFTGCSKKDASSDESAKKEASHGGAFVPKVAEGAILSIVGRSAENTSLAPLVAKFGLSSKEGMDQMPPKIKDVIKDLGLDKADAQWMCLTIGDVSAAVQGKDVPEVAVAMAVTLDLDQAVSVCEKKLKEEKMDGELSFRKTKVAGVDAYEVVCKGFKVGAKNVIPCIASLDKKLILAATSAACLEKQIALYRDGKGASADFCAFTLKVNDLIRVKAVNVGENVQKNLPSPDALAAVGQIVPNGDKIVAGLGAVELSVVASADGKNIVAGLSVETASNADAETLATAAKNGLAMVAAMLKDEKDVAAKLGFEALQSAKASAEGTVAALSVSVDADAVLKFLAEKAKDIK